MWSEQGRGELEKQSLAPWPEQLPEISILRGWYPNSGKAIFPHQLQQESVGPLTALAYVLIIGTPSRFARGKQIGTYAGMIPSEESSADKQRLGHISKQGNALLRFLLVEAAQAAARVNPEWRRRYIHLAMRRHKSIAKVAMGRRLAVRLYWMWRNGCEYSPSLEFGSYAGQPGTGHGGK